MGRKFKPAPVHFIERFNSLRPSRSGEIAITMTIYNHQFVAMLGMVNGCELLTYHDELAAAINECADAIGYLRYKGERPLSRTLVYVKAQKKHHAVPA